MCLEDKLKRNINLAPLTSFKIGGPAEYFFIAENINDLSEIINWAKSNNKDITILGGGSNILINDEGVKGVVIKVDLHEIQIVDDVMITGAGENLANIVNLALEKELSGMEWAIGIPGTVGGAVRGNAGAYGSLMSNVVEAVDIFDIENNKIASLSAGDCDFAYRHSVFKINKKYLILNVRLRLNKGDKQDINTKMRFYLEKRKNKLPNMPSAGSIFKNITKKELDTADHELLVMAEKDDVVKGDMIPAGWIINQLDMSGKAIGGAKISDEHANIIINYANAKADDVITLISIIKTKVRDEFNLQLQEEIEFIGF